MKTTENIICELREAHIGNELRSERLKKKMHDQQSYLTAFYEELEKDLPKEFLKRLSEFEEIYSEYTALCEDEAFYYGFKLGLKIEREE